MMTSPAIECTIAIVGGGFSGTLTAINTVRADCSGRIRIVVIDGSRRVCRGLAYRHDDDNFVLNVPAGNMSALVEEPDDFVAFCQGVDPSLNAKSFVSRRLYGEYLEHLLKQTMERSPGAISIINAQARSLVCMHGGRYQLILDGATEVIAERVVLAVGHFAAKLPSPLSEGAAEHVIDAFDFAAIDALGKARPVAILGMGHTAIDAVFRLTSCNQQRQIYMISRRGLLPHGHRFEPRPPRAGGFPVWLAAVPPTVRACMSALRKEVRTREAEGGNWRDVLNELRPYTASLWRRFEPSERRKFLLRVLPYWDVHRHRLSPASERRLRRLIESGQVVTTAGRVVNVEATDKGLRLELAPKGQEGTCWLDVGGLINGSGPNYDVTSVDHLIIRNLVRDGLIKQDSQKIGLEVDEHYRLIGTRGQALEGLHYIGPMLKANYWEAIAVPELRMHAQALGCWLAEQYQ
ncbi:FAD/NAD(P)-binding protein [Pseudomonas sp. TE50-2]|uniref:FAD/NAD(P)-binding protein n=1 Tax=Pseudomonas sp. TE50-2 TaxID=3142707 RepID=UPI0034664DE9